MGSNPIPSAIAHILPNVRANRNGDVEGRGMTSYHLWTVGCQMNVADSERLGLSLDQLGYESVARAEDADIVVLNSCVVRQGAEDKVVGRLDSLKSYKKNNPDATIALMGCMVGPRTDALRERFPHVDFFMRPQDFTALVEFAAERQGLSCDTGPISACPVSADGEHVRARHPGL